MEAKDELLADLIDHLAGVRGIGSFDDFQAFMADVEKAAESHNVKLTAKRQKLLQTALAEKDEAADPVVRKIHKPGNVNLNRWTQSCSLTAEEM